ncbi:MAG: hypothetical protein E6Q97_36090 [Desulfurellales bacterium]|nr:MAG: hypothetical protein E6Q97_36090 [Desulfurellales bacterium]
MSRPPFPKVLDSTLMSHFRACPRSAYLEFIEHWKLKTKSVHLHAGAAFARGIEVTRLAYYQNGCPPEEALGRGMTALVEAYGNFECPPDSAKSLERMMGALEYYFSEYRLGEDTAVPAKLPGGKLGIEFNFTEPIDVLHPETGDPLLYTGRFDAIMEYAGQLYGCDEKTTSQLGASWSKQWDLRSQFTAYTWGARQAGINLQGFIVRGVSILKTKYDTLSPITYRPGWLVDAWYHQLLRDVNRMINCWKEGYWDANFDESCNAYGGCGFKKVCMTEPSRQAIWLRQDFEKRRWDPILRQEFVVGEAT